MTVGAGERGTDAAVVYTLNAIQYEVDINDEQILMLLLVSWMASGSVHLAGT